MNFLGYLGIKNKLSEGAAGQESSSSLSPTLEESKVAEEVKHEGSGNVLTFNSTLHHYLINVLNFSSLSRSFPQPCAWFPAFYTVLRSVGRPSFLPCPYLV